MKLVITYTNGKTWKATNVVSIKVGDGQLEYSRYNKNTGIRESFSCPDKDIKFYTTIAKRETRVRNIQSRAKVMVG